jgi:two-component system, NtrC family, sensor kinase
MPRADKQFNRSLHIRLIIILLLATATFAGIFVLYAIKETRSVLADQESSYGMSLAHGIAASCSHILFTGDNMKLNDVITSIGSTYPEINAIEVLVAETIVAKYSSIDVSPSKSPSKSTADLIAEKGVVFEAPISLLYNHEVLSLGRVKVTLSVDQRFNAYVRQMRSSALYAIILLFVISGFLFFILDYLIVMPIITIEEGTKIIARGALEHRIDVRNKDQIGRLAFEFNQMAAQLKVSKQEIEQWNVTLENKVEERTQELQQSNKELKETQFQLVQSGKMAAIGLMGAGIAHELNNPLVGIIGYIQLVLMRLRKGELNSDEYETVQKNLVYVEKEAQRCKRIVDDLLNYARESKKYFEPVDLKRTLEQTVSIMEFQLKKWRLSVTKKFPDEQLVVMGASDKLQQVYINLISNAHHAMPEGGDLFICIDSYVDNGERFARIVFEDTGCGIPPEECDKVFQSFFSSKRDMNNLGLGLSISNQIIQEHKGKITVASELGTGTTFTIVLPIVKR